MVPSQPPTPTPTPRHTARSPGNTYATALARPPASERAAAPGTETWTAAESALEMWLGSDGGPGGRNETGARNETVRGAARRGGSDLPPCRLPTLPSRPPQLSVDRVPPRDPTAGMACARTDGIQGLTLFFPFSFYLFIFLFIYYIPDSGQSGGVEDDR